MSRDLASPESSATMSNSMQVDSDTRPQILGPAFTPTPLPSAVASPHPPEILELNKMMNRGYWLERTKHAGDDPKMQETAFAQILMALISEASPTLNFRTVPTRSDAEKLLQSLDEQGFKEWQDGVKAGVEMHDWARLANHPILAKLSSQEYMGNEMKDLEKRLASFYNTPFVGGTDKDLVEHLKFLEGEIAICQKVPYAKAFSIVQSSGTGKSRLLTEAGYRVFTLPICIRRDGSPGYPPADLEVVKYLDSFFKGNDLSFTAHIAVACLIAAMHTTMLKWLKSAQSENVGDLHSFWHDRMEPLGDRSYRNQFFSEVVALAGSLRETHRNLRTRETPKRKKNVDNEEESKPINEFAQLAYGAIIQSATKGLAEFLSSIKANTLCVTYFDEAHGMDRAFWVLLRLLQYQDVRLKMWFIFMGTKSSISYYAPGRTDMASLKLIQEMARLLPPYVALGFDHHAIANAQRPRTVKMGELQSIKHVAQYGRPLWKALLSENGDFLIKLAGMKLTNGWVFSPKDKEHVFAVLSQRLCLDPVLSGTEAVKLADRSVAHHMRLLIGVSENGAMFYTHPPSEPVLALGGAHLLYDNPNNALPTTLKTFCEDLCSAGLVEKGMMGELAARTLLLVARDFTAPILEDHRDLLKPVRLLDFLDTLFGKEWAGSERSKFDTAFANAYVNFTHWMVTKDSMPVEPDSKLLANLWARGAALQCCFRQKAIDLTIPVYDGPIDSNAVFDPSRLTGVSVQVKFQVSGEPQAESRIRPFGIPRDPKQPLPYLALLMELGIESNYRSHGKIKPTASGPIPQGEFQRLTTALTKAVGEHALRLQQVGQNKTDQELMRLKEVVSNAQLAADSYNRYAISVRGASPKVYQVLKKAGITDEFATLLAITTRLPGIENPTIQHMRPLERLEDGSTHTAWMAEYLAPRGDGV